jgi:uncharacterized lipoprotein YmbA
VKRRLNLLVLHLLVLLVFWGCTSPDPAYYTLAPVPGPTVAGGPPTIEVRRPGLAAYLDRTDIVRRGEDYRLVIGGGEQWGEPLDTMIGRVLTEDLTDRLPGSTVFSDDAVSPHEALVNVDIARFDADAQGTVTLLAQIAVQRGPNQPQATRSLRLTAQTRSSSTSEMAAVMSQLLGQLADTIATMLRPV